MLNLIDEAVAAGAAHAGACRLLDVPDDRVHRWRHRLREVGTLEDRAPGGVALHALTPDEIDAVLAIAEEWGEIDRSHRKLAHRGSYVGRVWVSPSTFRRVLLLTASCCPNAPHPGPRRHHGVGVDDAPPGSPLEAEVERVWHCAPAGQWALAGYLLLTISS